jgi:two-component system NarL family sensor kinase
MIGQERERKRIASELHDGLGQALALAKLTVEDALIRLHGGRLSEAREMLAAAVVRISEAIGDVRQICSELHPILLDRLGLVAALASLCRRVDEHAERSRVRFDGRVEDEEVPDSLKPDIFRIAQEAINNALRHGSASTISVSLERIEAGVLLTIRDDGVGFDTLTVADDPAAVSGLGLIGMRQRVESAGGSFLIQSSVTGGTLVSALWET